MDGPSFKYLFLFGIILSEASDAPPQPDLVMGLWEGHPKSPYLHHMTDPLPQDPDSSGVDL